MLGRILAYNSPVAGVYLLFMPIGIVLQGIYATHFGMALTAIASVFFIARIFDAVTDPIIGYLADKSRAMGISRKWWVIIGGVTLIACGYFLYVPPRDVRVSYFMFWSLAFYLAWTIFDVSHYAWGSELTREPGTRIRIFTVRGSMVYVGAIVFYVLPVLPIFDTTEFTPETLKYAVGLAAIYMLPTLYAAARYVPNGEFIPDQDKETILSQLRMVFSNKPFAVFVVIYILTGISGGMWISLTFIVFDSYYGVSENIAMMYFLGSLVGICGLPFWLKLSNRVGKKSGWRIAQCMHIACLSIPIFVVPGEHAFILLLISTIGIFFCEGYRQGVLPSLLADIIDYGTWKFGSDRAATYFAINTLLQKISIGVGAGSGLMLLGLLGFEPTSVEVGDESALFAVQLAFCILPAALILVSLGFLTRLRITARHSSIIRRRLAARTQSGNAFRLGVEDGQGNRLT